MQVEIHKLNDESLLTWVSSVRTLIWGINQDNSFFVISKSEYALPDHKRRQRENIQHTLRLIT